MKPSPPKFTTASLLALRDGSLPFAQFARGARSDIRGLVYTLVRRHPLDERTPMWFNWDDLSQDALMAVPGLVKSWDPESPMGIKSFVVYRLCSLVKKAITRARAGKQLEQEIAPVVRKGSEPSEDALQERVAMVQELMDLLPETEFQQVVLESVVRTQSIARSTRELARDPRTMRTFAVADDIASKKIRRVLVLMAQRAAQVRR